MIKGLLMFRGASDYLMIKGLLMFRGVSDYQKAPDSWERP